MPAFQLMAIGYWALCKYNITLANFKLFMLFNLLYYF